MKGFEISTSVHERVTGAWLVNFHVLSPITTGNQTKCMEKNPCVQTLHRGSNLWKKGNEWVEWVLQSTWLLSANGDFQGQWAWGLAEFKRQGSR